MSKQNGSANGHGNGAVDHEDEVRGRDRRRRQLRLLIHTGR